MLQTLASLIGFVAFGAWIVAALSFIAMLRLVPQGQRLQALWWAGLWQFDRLRSVGGPQIDPHARRFGWCAAIFFIAVFAGMILGLFASIEAQEASRQVTAAGGSRTLLPSMES